MFYLLELLFSALSSETRVRGQRKDDDAPGRHFSSQPSSKEKFQCVFCVEFSKGLMPWKRESCYVTSPAWGLTLVNEFLSMNTRQQWTKLKNVLETGGSQDLVLEGT